MLARLMAKEPGQRYQKPSEVVQALAPFIKGAPKPLSPPPPPPKGEQPVVAPQVVGETMGECSFPPAKGSSRPLPSRPPPPKGIQRPIGPQAMPETMLEGEATLAGSLRKENPTWSRKWIVVPLMIVLMVGLLGLWAIFGSRGPTTKKATNEIAIDKGPPRDVPEPRLPEPDFVARIKQVSGIDLVQIPAGEFYMGAEKGATDAKDDEKPQHKVRISGPFWLGKYKVTVGQFRRFVGATNYEPEAEKAKDKWTWRKPAFDQTDEHPVVCVSWNDAKAYCAWLAERTGAKVRLPREAEWEYSCRARSTTKYYFGNEAADLGDYAWYDKNTQPSGTRPCGQKKPNAFGLYDMHGLVYEWCDDGKRTYTDEVASDPVGAGASRVFRGGSFDVAPRYCRAAYRLDDAPSFRRDSVGFRVLVWR